MKVNLTIEIPRWLERLCVWSVLQYRRLRFGYPFRRIALSQGYHAIVDIEDYHRLNCFKWHAAGKGNRIYATRSVRMKFGQIKTISLHREIAKPTPGTMVDHRSRNTLDNRRANLRLATPSQNSCNKRKAGTKTLSRLKGIFFDNRRGKWYARIKINGNSVHLGSFADELAAGLAYDEAAKKYHGEFACLNFPV